MREEFILDFCFKGDRNYVQGPDIFDEALKFILLKFGEIRNIKYVAHKMLHHNAVLIVSSEKGEPDSNSIITFEVGNLRYYASVINNFKQIKCKQDFSETEIQASSIIEQSKISLFNNLNYSFSEIIVSMNKYYLQKMSDAVGKWIITKLELSDISFYNNVYHKKISLELVKNFNNMLTKSSIYIDGKQVGAIYFSLVK
ncbi:hypothetical protein GXP67_24510 [Rhodocytophaga rosea]|uniref:Uncharacterized protein n=1 Tax=Rhodocytophaga rosea TaxID=2704465 RepID=A0A6C0GPS3_9BACT|nr:hypothetical protein [Rhodocytophaga rosea]QHT69582.1 hypothetical protein GXP67_24510 [Rhodocytophaga rosea]